MIGKVYISKDDLDCFFTYVTKVDNEYIYGYRISFWEDGEVTAEDATYSFGVFEEENPYIESSKYILIAAILGE